METVESADGTTIAFDIGGSGPPLLLVHGVVKNHTAWDAVREPLEAEFTVYAMDRRGRGASGDAPTYAIEREYEDVLAVIDAIDARVHLLGHSFGGLCALGAATRTDALASLVLYEPPLPLRDEPRYPADAVAAMRSRLDAGDHEGVIETFYLDSSGRSPDQVEAMRADPGWADRVDAAPSLVRELDAVEAFDTDLDRFGSIDVPTLLLVGGESPEPVLREAEALHAAIPDSRIEPLRGQGHVAIDTGPEVFLDRTLPFLRDT